MKKTVKILSLALMIMLLVATTTTVMAASAQTGITPESITGQSDVDITGITNIGNSIVKVLTTIGIVASVIVLIVLGIKYMMGSAEEKAEYKKTLMPYIIGAALIFAASTIANIVYNFMQGF